MYETPGAGVKRYCKDEIKIGIANSRYKKKRPAAPAHERYEQKKIACAMNKIIVPSPRRNRRQDEKKTST